MAISDENGGFNVSMPVQPMGGGNYGGGWGGYPMAYPVATPVYGNFGGGYNNGFGGDWGSLIVLFLFAAMFGGFGGGWGMGGFGGFDGGAFPWLLASNANSDNLVQGGFNQAATASQLGDIQNSITTGFSNAEVASCNRAMDAMQTAYQNQISGLERSFAQQTALDTRLDGISSDLQKCCCDNELRTEQLRFTVATENAADREALSNGVRDIVANQTAGTQAILDKLCQQELDAERRENAELRSRINMLDLAQSQAAQTAALVADNTAQTQYIVNRVAPYPIPAYPVNNPYGCGNFGFGNGFGWNNGFNPFGNVGFGNGSF